MKNIILIIGGIITIVLTVLWYFKIITEPVAAIGTAILTFLGYLFSHSKQKSSKVQNKIKQKHYGIGDNVAGDKISK